MLALILTRLDFFFCFSTGIFLCLVLFLFAVMTWLVIYPGEFLTETLKLYNFRDMEFKFLLVALAALNYFVCFVIEVSWDLLFSHASHIPPITRIPLCVHQAL